MLVREQKKQGIALIMTLAVAALMMVLLGAFITVNRSNSALTGNLVIRQDAYNACLSGLHYAWSEIELNQAWGSAYPDGVRTFNYPLGDPKIRVRVHGDHDDPDNPSKNYMEGEILGSHDSFEIRLINNLQNRHVLDDTFLGSVPGRSARLEVLGKSNGKSLKLESVLRKSPYTDFSALSRRELVVEMYGSGSKPWKIRSKDPYVNQIRSNHSIHGPSALEGQIKFQDPPRGGVAMAHEDIELAGVSLGDDPSYLNQSQIAARGSFQTNAPEIEVPSLSRENLSFPTEKVNVPQGKMEMKVVENHQWTSRQFDLGGGNTVTRWRHQILKHNALQHNDQIWVSNSARVESDSGELNTPADGFPSPTTSSGFHDVIRQPGVLDDFPVLYQTDDQHRMRANLTTGEIAMTPGTTFEVTGDLEIVQNTDAPQAHLKFGYTMHDDGAMEFLPGVQSVDAMEDPASNSAALTTEGNLIVDGITTGFGSIYADQEVQLYAKSGLRAEPDLAVAVHGHRIVFEAEDKPDSSVTNTRLDADFEVYKDALSHGGYDQWDGFWDLGYNQRRAKIGAPSLPGGLRNTELDHNGQYYWDLLDRELNLGPAPNFNAPPFGAGWSGSLSLEQYVRLREYARSDDTNWLRVPGPRDNTVVSDIDNTTAGYSRWAERMEMDMAAYMSEDEPLLSDVYFVGLVHAGEGGFYADSNQASMLFEGSLVSQGHININNTTGLDFVYNRLYLDDVVRQFFGDKVELDQVYYRIHS